jgi:hypothetical protein
MKLPLAPTLCFLLSLPLHAEELTLETRPFEVILSVPATVSPGSVQQIVELSPKAWSSFEVSMVAPHGGMVKKGDPVLLFETEEIDRAIFQKTNDLKITKLDLAAAKRDLEQLEKTIPHKLAAAERAASIAAEEHDYFTRTRRKAAEDSSAERLKETRLMLENQREELKQLGAMYDADDLTEQTEEIILTRQKDRVAGAEFDLKMAELRHRRMMDVELPREAIELAEAERDTRIALDRAKADLPESLVKAKLRLAKLEQDLALLADGLAKLEADRGTCFTYKAADDGILLHGFFKAGKWEDLSGKEALKPHGKPALHSPLMTIAKSATYSGLVASLAQSDAIKIREGQVGEAVLKGLEDQPFPVKLESIATTPTQGSHPATFTATWGKTKPIPLTQATIRLPIYQNDKAIVIPAKAMHYSADGWYVKRKLAEGSSERHPVVRGRSSGEEVEITSGLEAGQVIVLP